MSKNIDATVNNAPGRKELTYLFNSQAEHLSQKQMQALLASNFAPNKRSEMYFNSLTTGWKKEKARRSLKKHWQIKDAVSVHATMSYIINEGERTIYGIMLPHFLSTSNKEERSARLKEKYMAVELLTVYSDNLSDCLSISPTDLISIEEKDMDRGVSAWDMHQMIVIARIAYDAGYLTEKEAWKYILQAYETCSVEFGNWTEVFKSILIGGGMKKGAKPWFKRALHLFTEILNNTGSPWAKLNFK